MRVSQFQVVIGNKKAVKLFSFFVLLSLPGLAAAGLLGSFFGLPAT